MARDLGMKAARTDFGDLLIGSSSVLVLGAVRCWAQFDVYRAGCRVSGKVMQLSVASCARTRLVMIALKGCRPLAYPERESRAF